MLKMLIADDDQPIRDSIATLIEWQTLNIEIVACCKNGIEALDAILDYYPDIVLTDIKMPGLSGLDLLQKMHQVDRDIEFILLSGYKEFEFAKQAMQFGVKHYLLKPVKEQQLIEAVEQVKNDILNNCAQKDLLENKLIIQSEIEHYHVRQFFNEILSSEWGSKPLFEFWQEYSADNNSIYQIYFLNYKDESMLPDFAQIWFEIIEKYSLKPIIKLVFDSQKALSVILIENPKYIPDIKSTLNALNLFRISQEIKLQEERFTNLDYCIARLRELFNQYSKIQLIDENRNFQEVYNRMASQEMIRQLAEELLHMADNNELVSVEQRLNQFWCSISEIEQARSSGAEIISCLYSHLDKGRHLLGIFDNIYLETNGQQLKELLNNTIIKILFPAYTETTQMIEKVKMYVKDHIADSDLSLKYIAENYLYMNVSYLCRQFNHETGEKFSAYLNKIRMEKAKELLLQYNIEKISHVAEQVGCGNNPRYFSYLFKKHTGMTPSKYMENNS